MSYTKSQITRIGPHDFDYWKVDTIELNGIHGFEVHWSDIGECITDHVYTKEDAYLIASAPLLIETLKHLKSTGILDINLIDKAIEVSKGNPF